MKLRTDDEVIVISGKDKGLTGTVLVVYPDRDKVLVEGVNRVKRHTKVGQSARGAKEGGIITQEAPIHISNVMLVCPVCKLPTRVGTKVKEIKGETVRVRVCKRDGCGQEVDK